MGPCISDVHALIYTQKAKKSLSQRGVYFGHAISLVCGHMLQQWNHNPIG